MTIKTAFSTISESGSYGGEAGIRTRARVTPTNGLANRPLQPTWVLLHIYMLYPVSLYSVYEANHERKAYALSFFTPCFCRGGESEIRTHGSLTTTPVFKTGALNQLDHLSV
jgi:hypothetical protein